MLPLVNKISDENVDEVQTSSVDKWSVGVFWEGQEGGVVKWFDVLNKNLISIFLAWFVVIYYRKSSYYELYRPNKGAM